MFVKARQIGLEPVLFGYCDPFVSRKIPDHGIDVVLELGDPRRALPPATERVRSPLVTAVATSAMARTCVGQVRREQIHVAGQVLPRSPPRPARSPGRPAGLRRPLRAPTVVT